MATILCVEDEVDLRQYLVEELESAGHVTIEAGHGREALECLRHETPDLILCDVNMPVMDGFAFLETVREYWPNMAQTPFIFLTALGDQRNVVEGKNRGADDYLTKPLDYDLLHATVNARLNQIERLKAKRDAEMVKLYRHLEKDQTGAFPRAASFGVVPPADPGSPYPGAADDVPELVFVDKVRGSRDPDTGEITVGRLHMIGLHDIKQELGPNWGALAERVRLVAKKTIEDHLDDGDTFSRTEHDEFVICFAALGQEDAWHKAKAIEAEIQRLILGDKRVDDLARSGPVPVSPSRIGQVDTDVRAVHVTDDDLNNPSDLAEKLVKRLREASRKLKAKLSAMLIDLSESCKIVLRPVRTRTGRDAGVDIEDFDATTRQKLANVMNLANGAPFVAGEIDILALGKAAEYILDNAHLGPKPVVVEISYSTLIDRQSIERLASLCREIGDFAKNHLVFAVKDIPARVDPREMAEAMSALSQYSKFQAVKLDALAIASPELRKTRCSFVVIQYRDIQKLAAKNADAVINFVESLRAGKVRVLVDAVPKSEFIEFVNRFPIDLLAIGG